MRHVAELKMVAWGWRLPEMLVDGSRPANQLSLDAGDLLLFRGRNSLHRVTPVEDDSIRQLAFLAYNNQPGISLCETAQMTFYGRMSGLEATV